MEIPLPTPTTCTGSAIITHINFSLKVERYGCIEATIIQEFLKQGLRPYNGFEFSCKNLSNFGK